MVDKRNTQITLDMDYNEAIKHSLTVKWKITHCNNENCWCAIIEPETPICDRDGNEIYIAASGCIPKEYAEHIVKTHNENLK